MSTRTAPFDAPALACLLNDDTQRWKWIDVESKSKIYALLSSYVPNHLLLDPSDPDLIACCSALGAKHTLAQSFKADVVPGKKKINNGSDSDDDENASYGDAACTTEGCGGQSASRTSTFNRVSLRSGFGLFCFRDHHGRALLALHQRLGDPVGSSCGPDHMTSWVLFTPGALEDLARFLSKLVEDSERAKDGVFPCFGWHIKYSYWQKETSCRARPLSSVILPAATKARLVNDIERFLSPGTAAFYTQHGIPYRRSYLFYGLPGTGKTSLVQALAGHFKRSVCVLQPTHPDMTDDALRAAILQVPEDSIVVLEDIDSLFSQGRENKVSRSSLTFSGLLNALDGVGSPNGQLFVLTTNLREQLDAALIRKGRVDIQVEFTFATEEQVCELWRSFYPASAHLAPSFHAALSEVLGGRQLVTSALQHFFVQQMLSSADEALGNVGQVVEELKAKELEGAAVKKGKKEGGADGPVTPDKKAKAALKKGKAGRGGSSKAASCSSKGSGSTAIHVHLHTAVAAAAAEGGSDDNDDDDDDDDDDSTDNEK